MKQSVYVIRRESMDDGLLEYIVAGEDAFRLTEEGLVVEPDFYWEHSLCYATRFETREEANMLFQVAKDAHHFRRTDDDIFLLIEVEMTETDVSEFLV